MEAVSMITLPVTLELGEMPTTIECVRRLFEFACVGGVLYVERDVRLLHPLS